MRTALLLAAAALLAGAAGCAPATGYTGQRAAAVTTAPATGPLLPVGSCAARSGTAYREVACDDRDALARVTRRASGPPDCPATTDLLLTVTAGGAVGATASPSGGGYACLRDLRPPHPGDPGQGGGPNTIVGDCLYSAASGRAGETACDRAGASAHPARYRITALVTDRARCPSTTALYVTEPRGRTACAERLP
ncbi:hypothetical protein [Streptomyces sp. ICBB 8177]|uniref:hypothetical protein n=1 Tax=Streptomyces sp. ICBB 8177 TaxID=563922 RepID=UPI000D67A5C4|nr:hypothetical protein [Streptomyces sp. ICBB 8177]PWI45429.1 hypothetical protein CK485_04710 [Streptomyces sp. ICBB 8177]